MEEGYITISDEIVVNVDIVAIILGADESLLQLDDVDGFSFEKISINDFKYKDKILMANQKMNHKYYLSQLQSDLNDTQNASFACLRKTSSFKVKGPEIIGKGVVSISDKSLHLPELEEYKDEQFELINRIISKLMLLQISDIGIFEVFCEFTWRFFIINNNWMCTVSIDDAKTLVGKKYEISQGDLERTNEFLASHNNTYKLMKKVIDGFAYSFKLLDNAKSFEQLVTVLEIMLLPSGQQNKKETLSKRMALLLGNDDSDIINIYDKVKSFYRFRSESTHEGIDANIGANELEELKELTRCAIMKFFDEIENSMKLNPSITFDEVKIHLINSLKTQVASKISAGILPA